MKTYNIASIAGDGIGTEVVPEAHKVLKKISEQHQFKLEIDLRCRHDMSKFCY